MNDVPARVRGLSIRRGSIELAIGDWSVRRGTVVGLVGRNGAGKTTLLSALVGHIAPHAGTIQIFGLDPIADPVGVRRRAAMTSDDSAVFAMPIGERLRALAPFWPTWDAELAGDLLRHFELDPRRKTVELSKGEHTRFRLVIAMAWRPELLLLDGPATGLVTIWLAAPGEPSPD